MYDFNIQEGGHTIVNGAQSWKFREGEGGTCPPGPTFYLDAVHDSAQGHTCMLLRFAKR